LKDKTKPFMFFIFIAIIGIFFTACDGSRKNGNEAILEFDIEINENESIIFEIQDQYREFVFEKLTENNCTITIFAEARPEYEENIRNERYRIEIKNNLHDTIIEIENFFTRPEPRIYWINDKLLRIDCGSSLAPSVYSYFYSRDRHILSDRFDLATGIIDVNNSLILCAVFDFTIYKIFEPEIYKKLDIQSDNNDDIFWFIIGNNSYFENKAIFLEYYDENNELKTEVINLVNSGLY